MGCCNSVEIETDIIEKFISSLNLKETPFKDILQIIFPSQNNKNKDNEFSNIEITRDFFKTKIIEPFLLSKIIKNNKEIINFWLDFYDNITNINKTIVILFILLMLSSYESLYENNKILVDFFRYSNYVDKPVQNNNEYIKKDDLISILFYYLDLVYNKFIPLLKKYISQFDDEDVNKIRKYRIASDEEIKEFIEVNLFKIDNKSDNYCKDGNIYFALFFINYFEVLRNEYCLRKEFEGYLEGKNKKDDVKVNAKDNITSDDKIN